MTTRHHQFDLILTAHRPTRLPGILGCEPVPAHGATVALVGNHGQTLCEWDELVADSAITDFETRVSFDVGAAWHIDIYYRDDAVEIMVWIESGTEATHIITVPEDLFFTRLSTARRTLDGLTAPTRMPGPC